MTRENLLTKRFFARLRRNTDTVDNQTQRWGRGDPCLPE